MLRLSQSQLNMDCPIQTEFLNKVNLDSTSLLDDNRPDMWTINSFLINVRAKQTAYGSQVPGLRMLLQIITIAYRACSWFNELQKIRCIEYFCKLQRQTFSLMGFSQEHRANRRMLSLVMCHVALSLFMSVKLSNFYRQLQ